MEENEFESEFENKRAWYIVQTYSGMEQVAKRNIEQRIISMNMQDYIFQVIIPTRTHIEKKKNGEDKIVEEKIYPSYLFIDMIVTDESWFIVRNTPYVTGFLGSSGGGAKPVPLEPSEMIPILKEAGIKVELNLDYKVGDTVTIISGNFANQDGIVNMIDADKQIVTVLVEFLGKATPVEVGITEVKPVN